MSELTIKKWEPKILLLYDNWRISKIEEFIENKFGHDLYSQEKEMKGGVDYGK